MNEKKKKERKKKPAYETIPAGEIVQRWMPLSPGDILYLSIIGSGKVPTFPVSVMRRGESILKPDSAKGSSYGIHVNLWPIDEHRLSVRLACDA